MKKIFALNKNAGNSISFFPTYCLLINFCILLFAFSKANTDTQNRYYASPLEGRWDLTLFDSAKSYPAWLEVHHSGNTTLVGQFVGSGGSARPISKVNFTNNILSFSIPPQWEKVSSDLSFIAMFLGDSLSGTLITPEGKKLTVTGIRAPTLRRLSEPQWGKQFRLFDGTDLKGWHVSGPLNQWNVENSVLISPDSGSNIISDQVFNDFKLHIEFRYNKKCNSGVYLRGRYEVQIIESNGKEPSRDLMGSVYGFISPNEMMDKGAGVWQSYDITLIGRRITLAMNGKTIICDGEIPGITGGALNSREGEPGPIMMQGDHGPIEFRNILVTPVK